MFNSRVQWEILNIFPVASTARQRRITYAAVVALGRTAGINADFRPAAGPHCEADATIALETNPSTQRFGTPALVKARFAFTFLGRAERNGVEEWTG